MSYRIPEHQEFWGHAKQYPHQRVITTETGIWISTEAAMILVDVGEVDTLVGALKRAKKHRLKMILNEE